MPLGYFIKVLKINKGRFYEWKERYGRVNFHNSTVPRDFNITKEEQKKIIEFYKDNDLEGYRRLTYLMIDQDIVYVSPSTTYRVLLANNLIKSKEIKVSRKGTGFVQPTKPHSQWHIDITYIKIKGVFYYLILVLDGYSRYIVGWDMRTSMTDRDTQIVAQKAKENFPHATPRVISDNGKQLKSREFVSFLNLLGMTHTCISPYYPQSNGKLERCNKTIKEYLRTRYIASFQDGNILINNFIGYYNTQRLHSAIGYITPIDKLNGKESEIFKNRDSKLEQARHIRKSHHLAN